MSGATQQTNKPIILAVDDTPENLTVVKSILIPDYMVKVALNGKTALAIANKQPPDMILLDIMMPEMDGHEVCQKLKANPKTADIPIIFVTAMGEEADELKGLAMGAVDYVSKPISPPILKARVTVHIALKQAQIELQSKNRKLQEERRLVEKIVDKMRSDVQFDNRHLRHIAASLEKTNGDVLFSAFRPDGGQHILLGDFTGHGLPAAIGGPLVSNIFYSRTLQGYSAPTILQELNSVLHRQLPTNLFMAAGMIAITPQRDALHLWNAGLPDGLWLPAEQQAVLFPSNMPPLGIIADFTITGGEENHWSAHDRLYLFSDGLIEAKNQAGEMFGYEQLQNRLTQAKTRTESLKKILDHVQHYSTVDDDGDDMTLLELHG